MPGKKDSLLRGANLNRNTVALTPEQQAALNAIYPGLGNQISQAFGHIGTRIDAQAGHMGTTVSAKLPGVGSGRKLKPAHDFNNQPITGVGLPEKGTDAINLDYFRGHLKCNWFEQMFNDCIELDEQEAAVVGAPGAIPWFWGWTIQHPHETDTLLAIFSATVDFGVGSAAGQGWFYLTPFPLQADGSFTNVAFRLDTTYTPTTTFPGVHWINFGLYNTDRELVWELGPYRIFASDGAYTAEVIAAFGRIAIDVASTSVPTGEYYLAVFLPSCLRLLCVDTDQNMWGLFNEPIPEHSSKYKLDNPLVPNFPAVIPDEPHDGGDQLQLIPLLLFTDFDTIGFTG